MYCQYNRFSLYIFLITVSYTDFIKTETASITTYFNLFLLLLAISVPADMFGFPYLGVLGKSMR